MGLLLYRFGMRTARRHPFRVVTVAAALMLVLAGCTPPAPEPTPTPSPAPAPVFASDEEALAAAEQTWIGYLNATDSVAADGGENVERLKPFLSSEEFEKELESFERYRKQGLRGEGKLKYDTLSLQRYADGGDSAEVTVYVCLDSSDTRLFDVTGAQVVPDQGRNDRTPLDLTFEGSASEMVITRYERWSGESFC